MIYVDTSFWIAAHVEHDRHHDDAKALLGRTFSVMKSRGVPIESEWAPAVFATVHPSAVLRSPSDQRALAEKMFVADLRKVARYLESDRAAKQVQSAARRFAAWPTTGNRSTTSSESTRSSRK